MNALSKQNEKAVTEVLATLNSEGFKVTTPKVSLSFADVGPRYKGLFGIRNTYISGFGIFVSGNYQPPTSSGTQGTITQLICTEGPDFEDYHLDRLAREIITEKNYKINNNPELLEIVYQREDIDTSNFLINPKPSKQDLYEFLSYKDSRKSKSSSSKLFSCIPSTTPTHTGPFASIEADYAGRIQQAELESQQALFAKKAQLRLEEAKAKGKMLAITALNHLKIDTIYAMYKAAMSSGTNIEVKLPTTPFPAIPFGQFIPTID